MARPATFAHSLTNPPVSRLNRPPAPIRLLDLAAILDRVDRGPDSGAIANDPRLVKIRAGLEIIHDGSTNRTEQIQRLFSLEFDPNWVKPQPRY